MWNDDVEDNNPYGSFERRDSAASEGFQSPIAYRPGRALSPGSAQSSIVHESPEFGTGPTVLGDERHDDDEYSDQQFGRDRRTGAYTSRVEQILDEDPQLPILIVDAGKHSESGGSYIVYTILTGDLEVRRRYSEFASLRATLVNLHPTLIIPPIPEKHTMADYAAKPTKAKEDTSIIDYRKRMLAVFLNRCRKMKEVREDGVWWRFLDPNASWNEVLHCHPVASVPKNNLKAPPLDPAHPTPAHNWLLVPASSAKLKMSSAVTPVEPPSGPAESATNPPTTPSDSQGRFPADTSHLSEQELDPYFTNFESATRDLESLLQGSVEKVNKRTLSHLSALAADMADLGARYNGFSLSEQSPTLAAAIERIGQAVDNTYIATEELSASLGATFTEPMRESAQFAGVVRSVLRYRILKRIQEDMTRDELTRKKTLLDSLEQSELEARRIEQYMQNSGFPNSTPRRSLSTRSNPDRPVYAQSEGTGETDSIDSDFPAATKDLTSSSPSASQGAPHLEDIRSPTTPTSSSAHKKSQSGSFVTSRIFGRISHAVHGMVDVDPERTRRDQIGKTKESLTQLEQALEVAEKDVKDASAGVLKDLKRFQKEKEEDIQKYLIAYARCHIIWAKQGLQTWTEAREEVSKIEVH